MKFLQKVKKLGKTVQKEVEKQQAAAAKTATGGGKSDNKSRAAFEEDAKKAIPGDVRMFSGCQDHQTSADVGNVASFKLPTDNGVGGAGGACTAALVSTLQDHNNDSEKSNDVNWITLLSEMRKVLGKKGYSQVPELSTSRDMDLQKNFSLINESDKDGKGTHKSLFIGINYGGQQGELKGCHNDVAHMKSMVERHGFVIDDEKKSRTLMDDGKNTEPTADNMLEGFQWLAEDAKAGDSLFLHYSGHGGSKVDKGGDEKDGKDETLIPVDYQKSGQITDDTLLKLLVLPLPEGVTLTCVMDCCHSGTVLDLPFIIKADDATMVPVEEGQTTAPTMAHNPSFSLEHIMSIGQELLKMKMSGASNAQMMAAAKAKLAPLIAGAGGARGVMNMAKGFLKK